VVRRGLTLGKFAPLHRGHQLVIETALEEMDEVVAIIYDAPATTRVPLGVRAGWIRELYPEVRVVEAWGGPEEVGDTPEIMRAHERYVIGRLGVAGITHFYCSEFYGAHMSAALGAVNRIVDAARERVPISATAIRRDPHACRGYLDPIVYRDLVSNIVLLGAPSTGKSTLAESLAREHGTLWMPEYGREYWELHQVERRLTPGQLVEIAEGHIERETALLGDANRYLFTDTSALTTYIFSLAYHGHALPRLASLAASSASRYDLVLLCDADIPYDDTWDRSGEEDRMVLQRRTESELLARRIPFIRLRGDLEARMTEVGRVLERYEKYVSLPEWLGSSAGQRNDHPAWKGSPRCPGF
jgi:NadR type nicotinamide-nucleotide adenylyltransferase